MNNRDRIIKTLQCEKTDRAPFGVGIGFSPWPETLERWRRESGIADLDPSAYFGYDTGFIPVPMDQGVFPHFPGKILEEDEKFIVGMDFRGITVRNRRDGGSMPEWLDYPVKTEADWEKYKAERLQPRLGERLSRLDAFAEQAKTIDAPIQIGEFPWGVFGSPRDLLGTAEYLIGFYTIPDLIKDMMKTFTDLWLNLYERVVEKMRVDHIHIWEDMSYKNGSLISMELVEEFMMPQYDRIVAFARRHNIPLVSVDSDGDVSQLIPVFMRHGINWMFPFEVQAGSDVNQFRDMYPNLGIMGGLDKNCLYKGKKEMNAVLDFAERVLAKGGYIPGFDHCIPPNASWENWKYFIENLKRIIGV